MRREDANVLIGRDRIAARVSDLGAEITRDLLGDLDRETASGRKAGRVVLVPVLTGSIVFVADLVRHMPVKMAIRTVTVSAYPGAATQTQHAKLIGDVPTDLQGAHVLIVDDILDSGRTLGLLRRVFEAQRPASLRIAVLLRKPDRVRREEVKVEYVGFDIGEEFVVGYGMDYDGYYRNVPEVLALKEAEGKP